MAQGQQRGHRGGGDGRAVDKQAGAAGQSARDVDVIGQLVASGGVHREDGPGPVDGDVRGQQLGVGQGHQGNGLIYETNNYKSFENNVIKLVQDARLRSKLSENACNTMIEKWNPKEAADRFYHLAKSLLGTGDLIYYEDGPISKALVLNNKWFSDDTI